MKNLLELRDKLKVYFEYTVIVEGKKDVCALENVGFKKVYALHQIGISLTERVGKIINSLDKKEKVCILTDFDKKGNELYTIVKEYLDEAGIGMENGLRKILSKSGISHIEGIDKFLGSLGED